MQSEIRKIDGDKIIEVGPSIFTSRNNATVKLLDIYEFVQVSNEESYKTGYGLINGKRYKLNKIIAHETGEILRY